MTRLSLRIRLTLVFACVMTLVLVAVGVFLYVRLGDELDGQLERRLAASFATLQAVSRDSGGDVPPAEIVQEDVVQVLGADGAVPGGAEAPGGRVLLDGAELAAARTGRVVVTLRRALGDESLMVVAGPLLDDGSRIGVVGASLESRDDAVNGLLTQLTIVIPIAILLASAAGYALAGAALRPVEAMRERAETISVAEPGARLPLPPAHDEIGRLGATLNAMLQRLEEGLERERRFVGDASHELRTPLALLRTELDLALRRPRSHDELERALRSASDEVERLTRLADDLLLLARTDEGQLAARAEAWTWVRSAARSRLVSARASTSRGGRSRSNVPRRSSPEVTPSQLERALGNLVDNALRHGAGRSSLSGRHDGDESCSVWPIRARGSRRPSSAVAFDRFTQADRRERTHLQGSGSQSSLPWQWPMVAARASRTGGGRRVAEIVLPLSR